MMAQEAALEEVARSKSRRLLEYNRSLNCTDVAVGDSLLFYKTVTRKSTPRRRGPATILDTDATRATAEIQSQTFKATRYCARTKMEEKGASVAEWNPTAGTMDPWDGTPVEDSD